MPKSCAALTCAPLREAGLLYPETEKHPNQTYVVVAVKPEDGEHV